MRVAEYPDQIIKENWEKLCFDSPYSSPFQTQEYFNCIRETPPLDSKVFGLVVNEELEGIMVVTLMREKGFKGFFSRRAIVFGGPVLNGGVSESQLTYFLKQVSKVLMGRTIYIETRNFFDYSHLKKSFIDAGWKYSPYLNYQLSLLNRTKADVLSSFSYNRRREIRQSLSLGATYGICENETEIAGVYEILKRLYRDRVKVPLPKVEFFLKLYSKGVLKVFCVKHEGIIIGGSFCPFQKGKSIYTFYYCGLREYNKKIFSTHLSVLAAIEFAIDNDLRTIDFMGAGRPDIQYGVRQYKSEFGGQIVENGRFIRILNPFMYGVGVTGLKLQKLLSK